MKFIIFLTLLFLSENTGRIIRYQHPRRHSPVPSGKYRISPTTGVRIALPTTDQLVWQAQELGVLIHFNMETYLGYFGCTDQMVPNITLFNPYLLNTDNWVQTMIDFGAKYAILVAKHGCGFLMAPSNVTFPLSPSGTIIPYNYTVAYSPMKGVDVLQQFIESCQKREVRTGFYYTVVANNWLNVRDGFVQNRSLAPGQVNITQETYDKIVMAQLRELWSKYGALDEIWFDGGYTESLKQPITDLLNELQADTIAFNGYGVSPNPVRWIGTEMGVAPDPTWSTGITNDGGDPDSPIFCPAECDTTLQSGNRWFWGANVTLRSLSELIEVYHQTVGRNCMLMLDFTPDGKGLIPPAYALRYKELGDFIRSCYDTSIIPSEHFVSDDLLAHILLFDSSPVTADRSVIREDQTHGQVIREYIVDVQLVNGTNASQWTRVAQGTSIGNKKIDIWQIGPQLINAVRLTISKTVDIPVIKSFTVHLCS